MKMDLYQSYLCIKILKVKLNDIIVTNNDLFNEPFIKLV